MTGITYLRGDATAPQGKGVKLIVHVCNDLGGWGKGFVVAVSRRWPEPEKEYRRWHRERARNDFGLGAVQFVRVGPYAWVANMVGQRGMRTGSKGVPVRYEAIDTGLGAVAEKAAELGASVHMPRIGCGLAGGTWSRVEPLVRARLVEQGIPVTVYDHGTEPARGAVRA
ncbi:macro domain-containing protein [Streptomyces wuyuanensis]|uniref:macro domain-containing protein n=1 Tax=Streptomyces wuyuanensis TaxID=1196353 RepID=UPI00343CFE2A